MRILKMREPLPDRRRSWSREVTIEGQEFHLSVGEYDDNRPGEVFIDAAKEGTFLKGVLGTLARMVSISLQHGANIEMVCHALRGIDYSPSGQVFGSPCVHDCYSVTDWVASELEDEYQVYIPAQVQLGEGDPIPEKSAGHIPEAWRVGA